MKSSIASFTGFLRRFGHARRGATAVVTAISMVVLVGFAGFALDIGHVLYVQRALQASTDAAALAGALDIDCCSATPGKAITTATAYSAVSGGQNTIPSVTVTAVTGFPVEKCLTSISVSCTGSDSANAIPVSDKAVVPMIFAQILGIPSMTVTATSTAAAKGGNGQALNVMIVLDTTASMSSNTDNDCGLGGSATREQCALAGVQALLQGLNPSLDYVGPDGLSGHQQRQ
jgi:Flp pilus assembly protein TadG